MKTNADRQYHIDVSEEESKLFVEEFEMSNGGSDVSHKSKKDYSLKKTFLVIAGVHFIGVFAFVLCSLPSKANEVKPDPIHEQIQTNTNRETKSESEQPIAANDTNLEESSADTKKIYEAPIDSSKQLPLRNSVSLARYYVVKKGDTLFSIAKKYKLSTKKLIQLNDIKDPNRISVGQTLKFM